VERGTFSHRHAVLSIEDEVDKYTPLQNISPDQAPFTIYNSSLSEYGVLGFDYGYSLATPNGLTVWEAQFGDFANGAQIIFDQFLSSGEDKWNVMSPLTIYLPHGYEGQGPEHSSARMERFLTLAAECNLQIANCTTPANFFHLLRRQLKRPFRKPLIIFTPKSLLRHPKCISTIDDLAKGHFMEVLDDTHADPEKVTKVIFCSGKLYYDLMAEQDKIKKENVAVVRIEQLFPFPKDQLMRLKDKYKNAKTFIWAQEEPANMGAWEFVRNTLEGDINVKVIARPPSGSTATGSSKFHALRQQKIIDKAFEECDCPYIGEECKMACIGNKWKSFDDELKELHVENIDSKFHSGTKPLK
jgi:2-oxoglutarate dehydrogenase E1 component